VNHDRVHAREPSHRVGRWSVGVIESVGERDGHAVVTVRPVASEAEGDESERDADDALVELTVTVAVRDLFVRRLSLDEGESPVGERVWYRERGG